MRCVPWIGLVVVVGLMVLGFDSADPSSTAYQPTWTPPTLAQVESALDGLSFDRFVDVSYEQYLLRFPQALTNYGLAAQFGVRNDRLDDYSEEYLNETRAIESFIDERLRSYDRESLSPQQQITYDVCLWYWDDLVRAHQFPLHDYLVTNYYITSRDWTLYDLMTVVHPRSTRHDVEDYMARLHQVATQFDQLIAGLDAREQQGIVAPQIILQQAVAGLRGLVYSSARSHPFYTTLAQGLSSIPTISSKERTSLLEDAADLMADEVLPATKRLYDKIVELEAVAPESIGYSSQPNGLAYYEYALRHQNQTTMTPEEIHNLGLEQVARLQTQIRDEAAKLGYPEQLPITDIYARVAYDGGRLYGQDIVSTYEEIIQTARANLGDVFDRLPQSEVVVVADTFGGYYRPSNGARPAEFVAPVSGIQPYYSMPTLAYHETIPGHHLQIGLAMELNLPLLRKCEVFLGFTEGWALYAERLAWELGWYDDDPYGNMGRLSDEMMRAARLVVDTGIHAMGWTFDQAVDYFVENTGKSVSMAQGEVLRYIVWPGQSTAYMIGFLKILDLRDRVQEALGENFDLAAFHTLLLENGSLPLELLEQRVDAYIAENAGA